jgi:cytochrome c-type biogenesis protein CcmE
MSRKKKLVIAGVAVVVMVIGLVIYIGLSHTGGDNLTVGELKAKGDSVYGHEIRVKGKVVFDSVDWDAENLIMRFTLTDGQDSLKVVYRDLVPDFFKPGDELVVEGEYSNTGIFEAYSFVQNDSPFCQACH